MNAREYDRRNPRFAHTDTGVASNHSSTTPSVSEDLDHAQSDDALQNVSPPQDPNISGAPEMVTPYTWLAGKMDGWKENDDYREYFEQSRGCDGMLCCDPRDGDYDDNGGYPTATGHDRGDFYPRDASYPLGPVIVRRI